MSEVGFSDLVGKTILEIDGLSLGKDRVEIRCADGSNYVMYHSQDCCEGVDIDDVVGDVADLIGSQILLAEETTDSQTPKIDAYNPDSFTWTFYKLSTIKGSVTIKWYGTSNGYYSESVTFTKTNEKP